ncbi:MAG: hypothetical protein K1060chlam1_00579, partial [Candidatus Anoxychlamydiales bacterium]|nr:hypothetical protein [Candidatus Anoxychlamydiales bacterium]
MLKNKIKKPFIYTKKVSAFLFALALFILNNNNLLAVINVPADDTLAGAITTANGTPQLINITAATTTLAAPLPAITNGYTIEGNSNTLNGGPDLHRGFIILGSSANPIIQNLKITRTKATGGDAGASSNQDGGTGGGGLGAGGAIYVGDQASVTLSNITYDLNNATGGNSPVPSGASDPTGGSGGGGLGGDGDNGGGAAADGGGGGGILEAEDASGRTGGSGTSTYIGADGANSVGPVNATTPGIGGGGGGAAEAAGTGASSAGGFGGGGGGGSGHATDNINAATGGFGGGGGGGGIASGTGGTSDFGGGAGAAGNTVIAGQGGGGAGLGGAIFIDSTSTATILDSTYDFGVGGANSVTAGTGNASGSTAGTDIFLATGGTLNFDMQGGTVTVTKNIEADTLLTTGGVTVNDTGGTGTLELPGLTNTFGGTFTITSGEVEVNSVGTPFGNTTSIEFSSGGLTISKIIKNLVGTRVISQPITMAGPGTFDANGRINISSAISGANTFRVIGGDVIDLLAASPSFIGNWEIDGGTLIASTISELGDFTNPRGIQIRNGGTLSLDGTITLPSNTTIDLVIANCTIASKTTTTVDSKISGAGNLIIDTFGAGSFITIINNATNDFSGPTTVNANATLKLRDGIIDTSSSLTIDGTFQVDAASGAKTIPYIASGASTGTINQSSTNLLTIDQDTNGSFTGVITGGGPIEKDGANTLTLNSTAGSFAYIGILTNTLGTLEIDSSSDLLANATSVVVADGSLSIKTGTSSNQSIKTLSGTGGGIDLNEFTLTVNQNLSRFYAGVISGSGGITKEGLSILEFQGANTYSGATAINAGTINLNATGSIANSSSVTLTGLGTLTLLFGAGAKTIKDFSGTIDTTLSLSQASNKLILFQTTSKTFAGDFAGLGGAFELTSSAPGDTLSLTRGSLYTNFSRNTTVTSGTLEINSPADLLVESSSVIINGGTLKFTALTTSKSINNLSGSGGFLDITDNTLTINQNLIGTYAGDITDSAGAGNIVKAGSSTLTLTGANTYSGATTINAGSLTLSNANSISSSSSVTLNNAASSLIVDTASTTIKTLSDDASGTTIDL